MYPDVVTSLYLTCKVPTVWCYTCVSCRIIVHLFFHQKNVTLHKPPSAGLIRSVLKAHRYTWHFLEPASHSHHPLVNHLWTSLEIKDDNKEVMGENHLGKSQLKFNQGLQDQDLCRDKQASNKNVNNSVTGFFPPIFNASGRKRMLFLPRSLLWAPEDFSGLSPSGSMLSDWCHWDNPYGYITFLYHIPHVWRWYRRCCPTGMNLCQAQGLFLLVEEAWWGLVAGFRHDLNLLVFEGSFPHLVIHELILLEHAQLHLRLDTHDLRDTTGHKTRDAGDLEASE